MISTTRIRLDLKRRLENKEFREAFFRSQAKDEIAISIKSLRRLRNERQIDLAKKTGMLQSAISRIEQAEYGNWSLQTLFRIADALDARVQVFIEPVEKIIHQYEEETEQIPRDAASGCFYSEKLHSPSLTLEYKYSGRENISESACYSDFSPANSAS